MHKFFQFDLNLNIGRLPLIYSLGDLSSIREIFTPEDGDIGRTQLPILPPTSEMTLQNGNEVEGYLVEITPALLVSIREFLQRMALQLEHQQEHDGHHWWVKAVHNCADIQHECMNRIGIRLLEVIKQDRRLGVYNLFWLVISKYIVTLLDQVIAEQGQKGSKFKVAILPIIAQSLQDTLQQVNRYLQKVDAKKRHYSPHIDETISSHLGATFNYEFSRSIITDQIHLLFPHISRNNLKECAQIIFREENERYHITYPEFVEIYSGVRAYIGKRLHRQDSVFCKMIANVLRIPLQSLRTVPIEVILFHPTIISLFAEEIKQIPVKSSNRKKTLFKSWAPQLGNIFGEGSWDFAMNEYLTFAKDLRKSEIIAFFRNRIAFVNKHRHTTFSPFSSKRPENPLSDGIADRISYQFDKGRIIHDLRNVTLAFLDLRGFTELSAGDITDQELKEQLYAFFDPVGNIINHFEGTIKTYAGDGILASFGAQKGHALNAVRAAVEIQKLFHILKHEGKIAFTDLGIGIHSGLVEETYFFSDAETSSHNTVIGLTANLVGRLSSGKTEKKRPKFDTQAFRALRESVEAYAYKAEMTPTTIAIFEDQLFHAVETIKNQQARDVAKREGEQELSVKIISGVLNNNGIAISTKTFQHIHALQTLQEIEIPGRIQYTFFDHILQERILLAKAGDATFKGIEEKIPVWGVYLYRHSRT